VAFDANSLGCCVIAPSRISLQQASTLARFSSFVIGVVRAIGGGVLSNSTPAAREVRPPSGAAFFLSGRRRSEKDVHVSKDLRSRVVHQRNAEVDHVNQHGTLDRTGRFRLPCSSW
jgi:hypothetical protein